MRMSPATKMMVMSDRYSRAGGGGDNTDRSGGRATPRTNTAQGHTYSRTQDMARDDTRYGRDRNASRSYGYDPDVEVNQRGAYGRETDDEDDWHGGSRGKPQRMYAAGMAWTDGGGEKQHGKKRHDHEDEPSEVDEHKARKWVKSMHNADGTPAPHFDEDKAETLRKAHCPDCDQWEWYVALNMMYADYVEVAKKMQLNKDEFYLHMAKAFLMDEDAGEGKLAKYMEVIPKG